MIFSTGIGNPQRFPFVPVLKVSGNHKTLKCLSDYIDKYVKLLEKGTECLDHAEQDIYKEIKAITSGKMTKAEVLGCGQFSIIFTIGPVI